MSSLPSISHRLFVAALGQERPTRPRGENVERLMRVRGAQPRPDEETSAEANETTFHPLAGEISTPALVSES